MGASFLIILLLSSAHRLHIKTKCKWPCIDRYLPQLSSVLFSAQIIDGRRCWILIKHCRNIHRSEAWYNLHIIGPRSCPPNGYSDASSAPEIGILFLRRVNRTIQETPLSRRRRASRARKINMQPVGLHTKDLIDWLNHHCMLMLEIVYKIISQN